MNVALMWDSLPKLLGGLVLTLELVALSLFLGFFVAVGLALMRLSSCRPLSGFARPELTSSSEVLPAPFGPMTTRSSRRSMKKLR